MDKRADCSVENRPGEGSKNKRKLVHPSILPNDISSSLIEFPRYELSAEISQGFKAEFTSSEVGSNKSREEPEVHMRELADWNDPIASPLEELLLSSLKAIFLSAIRQIVEFGYSEDVAEKAISRKGLYIGAGDSVSNIVHDSLNFLNGKDLTTRDIVFENFQHLLHYTMVEMVSVLREVRPFLTVGEVMWLLLICDLNILQACAVEEDLLSGFVCGGESSANCINHQSKSETQIILSTYSAPNIQKDSSSSHQNNMSEALKFGSFLNSPNNQSPLASEGINLEVENASLPYTAEKSSGTPRECAQAAPQLSSSEGKSGSSSKCHDRKEIAALRKKFLHMEKTCRACGKGGFKSGKLANIGGFVVEKRLKTPSEIPSQHMKGGSSNRIGTKVPSVDGMCQVSTNAASALPAGDSSGTLPSKGALSTNTVVDTKNLTTDKKSIPTSELSLVSDTKKILDYCAGIPYNESLGKYVPQDKKDKLILKLVLQVQKLQDELRSWNDWTRQKVMQVAQRLSKDQAELNILRKEKREAELFTKEKKILEENAMKRTFEMENAVANATSQIESANSVAYTLEVENSVLKKELGAAKLWAVKSMASHQQALEREQMALKKGQSCESQKGLLLDELEREKHKLANLEQKVDKEKNLQVKVEGRLEQERVGKEKLLAQAASIRKERGQLEAREKVEEDMIRKKAANDMQKYVEDIGKLEKELTELKLKSEFEKIAALRRGIDGENDSCSGNCKSTPTVNGKRKSDVSQMIESFQDNLATGSLRREQECVMCLSEEMSVVFLPCAHQVVCAKCNELHEKQGMNDCPSCRTPIQQRIRARFAG